MKQKKQKDITMELIYKELTGFITKQEEFNAEVKDFMVKQEEFNTKQEEFNERVIARLDSLENKVDAILECPTIKREIKLL